MKRENEDSQEESNGGNGNANSGGGGGGGGGGTGNKRNRKNDDIVRLLIPSRIAGAVIGKSGQHIQKMRSQYKATVSVDDCQGPERTILISSDFESVLNIIKEMLKYFEEKDDEVDVRMLIHQSLAGCVIGQGGSKIKEIRDKIGCRILKVFSNVAPQSTDRIVQAVGKPDQCVEAIGEVLKATRETPIKGSIHNYDPINYDDIYADEYGGYGVSNGMGLMRGGGGGGNRQSRMDRQVRGGNRRFGRDGDRERRNDRSRSDGRRDREYISPWANDGPIGGLGGGGGGGFGSGMGGGFGGFGGGSGDGFGNSGNFGGFGSGGSFGQGGNSGFGGNSGGINFGSNPSGINFGGGGNSGFGSSGSNMGGGNMGNGLNRNMGGGGNLGNSSGGMNNGPGDGDKNSTQVTIPKDLAGAIIGKGGGRIRRIRNDSGAYITIDEPLPGSNDRIITISGNPKQIQMAQYLLQQSVHENKKGRF